MTLLRRIRDWGARHRLGERGNVAVEFALVMPVVIVTVLALWDLGQAYLDTQELRGAARAGAQLATKYPTDEAGIRAAVAAALGVAAESIDVTRTGFCECGNGAAQACADVCADGTATREFVTVAVTQPFVPLFSVAEALYPPSLQASATMRIR